jgi:hypothetical protein
MASPKSVPDKPDQHADGNGCTFPSPHAWLYQPVLHALESPVTSMLTGKANASWLTAGRGSPVSCELLCAHAHPNPAGILANTLHGAWKEYR